MYRFLALPFRLISLKVIMSSRESVIVFDDGSLESKTLQFELKTSYDLNVVQVKPFTKLDNWLAEIIDETDQIQKIFLHFPSEDYITTDLRDQVNFANHNYPLLRIVPWYEKASRDSLKHRAANYGIQLGMPADKFIEGLEEAAEQKPIAVGKTITLDKPVESWEAKKEEFKDKRRRKKVA